MRIFKRLDKILVEKKIVDSRTQAQELICGGRVTVGGIKALKPSSMFSEDVKIEIESPAITWVSRGAFKLLKALDFWSINAEGLSCIDIGASTGGFTDVLLNFGAKKVAAIDVGYGQLAWKLRQDERVSVYERTNARYLSVDQVGWEADLIVADASFISLRLLLPVFERLIKPKGQVIALLKPQFEVGRGRTQNGVVKRQELHREVVEAICTFIKEKTNFVINGVTHSPIKGPEGNIEFLVFLEMPKQPHQPENEYAFYDVACVTKTVQMAHGAFLNAGDSK